MILQKPIHTLFKIVCFVFFAGVFFPAVLLKKLVQITYTLQMGLIRYQRSQKKLLFSRMIF